MKDKRIKLTDEQVTRMEQFEQAFKIELRSRLMYGLREAQESLSQSQEHGTREDIIRDENAVNVLQAQLDYCPPAVIDSTAVACYPLLEH